MNKRITLGILALCICGVSLAQDPAASVQYHLNKAQEALSQLAIREKGYGDASYYYSCLAQQIIPEYEQAIKLSPSTPELYLKAAQAYQALGCRSIGYGESLGGSLHRVREYYIGDVKSKEKALAYYKKALELGKNTFSASQVSKIRAQILSLTEGIETDRQDFAMMEQRQKEKKKERRKNILHTLFVPCDEMGDGMGMAGMSANWIFRKHNVAASPVFSIEPWVVTVPIISGIGYAARLDFSGDKEYLSITPATIKIPLWFEGFPIGFAANLSPVNLTRFRAGEKLQLNGEIGAEMMLLWKFYHIKVFASHGYGYKPFFSKDSPYHGWNIGVGIGFNILFETHD